MRLAARAEQEIRAYPRLHRAFYVVVNRNPAVRGLVGRVKDRVRSREGTSTGVVMLEEPCVQERRHAGIAARLGLEAAP